MVKRRVADAARPVDRDHEGLGTLLKIAMFASSQADLRSWLTLPKDFQVARVRHAVGGAAKIPAGILAMSWQACRAPRKLWFFCLSLQDSLMQYRRLGRAGLQVSELSLGSWVTYHNQVDTKAATEMLAAAFDAGVNFFDNAEVYAQGESEVVMGKAFKALGWNRLDYIVSSKFFWGLQRDGVTVNRKDTLNRKYSAYDEDAAILAWAREGHADALPPLEAQVMDFSDVRLATSFFGFEAASPCFISSMTAVMRSTVPVVKIP